ncbi:GPW/gp25 family protein [Albidovulum sp.]|uniref:GPW/gp25 family protein n=1 Tax=Albidovulum sp. TaxID=1872424 RepID=UPI0039B8F8C1
MIGLSRQTGGRIEDEAHLAQSVVDILSTPRGTRVMRRDYGSDLPLLIDRPINGETIIDVYQATAEALARWEPRIRLTRVEIEEATAGGVTLQLTYETDDGTAGLRAELGGAA